jgi:hypothetical protein
MKRVDELEEATSVFSEYLANFWQQHQSPNSILLNLPPFIKLSLTSTPNSHTNKIILFKPQSVKSQ